MSSIPPRTSRKSGDGLRHLSPWSFEEATEVFHLDGQRDLKQSRLTQLCVDTSPGAPPLIEQQRARAEHVRQYFHVTCELYEKIFEHMISDESYTVQPIHKLRHPMVFYLGHCASFYINKLAVAGLTTRINPKYEEMFATGVDEMSWDDLNDAHYSWPKIEDVWYYRSQVRIRVNEMFDKYLGNKGSGSGMPLPLTFENSTEDGDHSFFWAVMMGIEHDRIHVETASVHLRELPLKYVVQGGKFWSPWPVTSDQQKIPEISAAKKSFDASELMAKNPLVTVLGENEAPVQVPIGRPPNSSTYGWDCDYSAPGYTMECKPFSASKCLVSNADYLVFMKDGGYSSQKYWDEEGWGWVSWKKPTHPWFWVKDNSQQEDAYKLRVQCDEIPLPWNWPAELNHLEAKAYCNWLSEKTGKNLRLPTEREWCHMWDKYIGTDQAQWKKNAAPGNINFERLHASSCPVTEFKHGDLYDVVGNVWQHLETPTYPYPGFRVHPLYDDFSMPTFDGRHKMMRGGAWISTGNEASRDARFAFRRHFFQFIGVRFIEGPAVDEQKLLKNILGMDPLVDLAAQKAFKTIDTVEKHYGEKVAQIAFDAFAKHSPSGSSSSSRVPARALEVQCGAGRVTFELASKGIEECIGVNFTARDLQPAFSMKERGCAVYSYVTNAVTKDRQAHTSIADTYEWKDRRDNVFFYQSDPANLHAHLDNFDLIVSFDALSHTYRPNVVPQHLLSRLSTEHGGVLIMFEPRAAGTSAVTDETLASVQQEPRPASSGICDMLISAGATSAKCLGEQVFDICDGIVSEDRVGMTRVKLDVIVAVKKAKK